ncbi:MAG TPA: protein kinase [Nocardioides sp.]|uniref:serine/threonine-protein kinase n=1 Tax=Nocardioides sp. TaxID=35761 RepID=UPI002C9C362A|nr:protein kinase [Nocardioides sp.]HTW15964.1 protein kinase [Nocardioides sp.]
MPSRLGRYAVRRRIGSGAFATVWLAYDEQLDAPVAVKVLADNWTDDHQARRRFLEEGRYLRRVESPHVVQVFDAGELDDGRPYLVMSYADQGTLADGLEIDGLTAGQALEVVRQVGAGLTALHRRDILHRDVKPANVLFRSDEGSVRAMVADLGLGKALDVSSRLTAVAGTPSFVAPEQAQGEPLDARADQYSLGALSYLLLAGRAPYSHASLAAAARPVPPPPLSTPERPYDDAVDAVLRRALAADREERWPDVEAYVDALAAALDGTAAGPPAPWLPIDPELTQPGGGPAAYPEAAQPAEQDPRSPAARRWPAVLLGVGALVAGALGGFAWEQSRPDPDVTVSDDDGTFEVTVPASWHRAVATGSWTPPTGDGEESALSVGTDRDWHDPEGTGEGVFVGVLGGTELPEQLPQHPECAVAGPRSDDVHDGDEMRTVRYEDCPGGLTVERAVQVTADRLVWIQVRSRDRATANRVLDSVAVYGM